MSFQTCQFQLCSVLNVVHERGIKIIANTFLVTFPLLPFNGTYLPLDTCHINNYCNIKRVFSELNDEKNTCQG